MTNRFTGWLNGRRLALTIARRSMRRNLLQSLLIVLIIAVPVAAGSAGAIYIQSRGATPAETATMALGQTQARFVANVPPGKNIYQEAKGQTAFVYKDGQYLPPSFGDLVNPTSLYPNAKWITERMDTTLVKTRTGVGNFKLYEGNIWDSAMSGRYDLISGTAPTADNQVLLTQAALERTNTKVGSVVKISKGNRFESFKVVGIFRAAELSNEISAVAARTGAVTGVQPSANLSSFNFYLVDNQPVTWNQVVNYNSSGIGVYSRQVILTPPNPSQVPFNRVNQAFDQGSASITSYALGFLILIPVILLPIFVLAGSAFAFGARRQQRSLAVLSSLGAKRGLLRFITVANGIWLGLLGGALGLVLGLPLAAIVLASTSNGSKLAYPGYHVSPWIEFGILFGGAAIGAIVSAIPAISAAKVDVLSTLRGTRLQAKVKVRTGIFSLLTIALGLAIVIFGLFIAVNYGYELQKTHGYSAWKEFVKTWAAPIGSIIVILGLILGSGWLLKLLRWLLSGLGVAATYASNDLIYNRRRYQGVIAGVIATSFVGATVISLMFSIQQANNELYRASLPKNQITADADWAFNGTLANAPLAAYQGAYASSLEKLKVSLKAASSIADVRSSAIVNRHELLYKVGFATSDGTTPKLGAEGDQPVLKTNSSYLCPWNPNSAVNHRFNHLNLTRQYDAAQKLSQSPRYVDCDSLGSLNDEIWVGDVAELEVILGHQASDAAKKSLQEGGAVSFRRGFLNANKVILDWHPSGFGYFEAYGDPINSPIKNVKSSKTVKLAAVYEPVSNRNVSIMISPQTAKRLGISSSPQSLFVNFSHDLTLAQKDQLQSEVGSFYIDNGYPADPEANAWWVLLAVAFFVIAATGIALGLAQIEATADRSTLVSVGAPRRFRAKALSLQALMLTLLGTVFGSAVGYYLSYSLLNLNGVDHFRVAIWQYSLLVVGIPVVTAIGFWIGTPRREPFKPRLAIE